MNITIRPCLRSELETLCAIGRETYDDTFREMNTAETMERYLEEAFNAEKMLSEWSNPDSRFYFLYVDADLAGYLKVNDAPAQSDVHDPQSLEIERIYIRKAYKGKGLGTYLMNYALQLALDMGKRYAWLGVWEKNTAAIAFYQKMGFEEMGRHTFKMGDELQSDWIMKKEPPLIMVSGL
jgi:ribosomal protein S18 acetylase RimI-like enzyme